MEGAHTRGQPIALLAIGAMLRSSVPHALMLVGPAGVGKTTLGLDLAAALLCAAPDPARRPCRICRACRMIESGNHPDLHRLAPSGPGAQIGIGGGDRGIRGVRDLIGELVLMPVEGGSRVAVIEDAQRLNEDAQSALLKTLEEPPAGVVIVLCVAEEDRLLPTVRSRCARILLGPVGVREIEALLGERDLAEPPTAARLARIAGGRPGVAISYARAPEAETIRAEIARRLLDLLHGNPAAALVGVRELLGRGADLGRALEAPEMRGAVRAAGGRASRPSRSNPDRPLSAASEAPGPSGVDVVVDADGEGLAAGTGSGEGLEPAGAGRLPAPERRKAALTVLRIWQDLVRDLALVSLGEPRRVRDPGLLDELESAAERTPAHAAGAFLGRLVRSAELLDGNVAPELIFDVLVLAWRAGSPPARQA